MPLARLGEASSPGLADRQKWVCFLVTNSACLLQNPVLEKLETSGLV